MTEKPVHKPTHHELKEDSLVTWSFLALDWAKRHTTLLAAGAGAVVLVLVVGSFSARARRESREEVATRLLEARGALEGGDLLQASTLYDAIVDRHGGSSESHEAAFLNAGVSLELGRHDKAERLYSQYLQKKGGSEERRLAAQEGLAAVLEAQAKNGEAAAAYAEAARVAAALGHTWRASENLWSAARCQRNASELDASRKTLLQLVEQYPESDLVQAAQLTLAELGYQLGATDLRAHPVAD